MRASTTTATASIAYRRPTQALQLACVLAISLGLSACGTWLEPPPQAGHDPVFRAPHPRGPRPVFKPKTPGGSRAFKSVFPPRRADPPQRNRQHYSSRHAQPDPTTQPRRRHGQHQGS